MNRLTETFQEFASETCRSMSSGMGLMATAAGVCGLDAMLGNPLATDEFSRAPQLAGVPFAANTLAVSSMATYGALPVAMGCAALILGGYKLMKSVCAKAKKSSVEADAPEARVLMIA